MQIEVNPSSVLAAAADLRAVQRTVEQLAGALHPLRANLSDWSPDPVLAEAVSDLHDSLRWAAQDASDAAGVMAVRMVAAVEVYGAADDLYGRQR